MVSAIKEKPVELVGCVQNYDWGIKGSESLVAQVFQSNSAQEICQEKPYAEVIVKDFQVFSLLYPCVVVDGNSSQRPSNGKRLFSQP